MFLKAVDSGIIDFPKIQKISKINHMFNFLVSNSYFLLLHREFTRIIHDTTQSYHITDFKEF